MIVGDTVTVVGKSLKGKNRIREHGDLWKVVSIREDTGEILLESHDKYLRWMQVMGDRDFKLITSP